MSIERGGDEFDLRRRIDRILKGKAPYGLVTVMDEDGMIDFGHNVTTPQVRDALLAYARDLAAYEGD